nr:hypothetical protein [Trichocoleus desertorum]
MFTNLQQVEITTGSGGDRAMPCRPRQGRNDTINNDLGRQSESVSPSVA